MNKSRCWGVRCQLPSCKISIRQFPDCQFFKFPLKNQDRMDIWINACFLKKTPTIKNAYICANHFDKKYIGRKYLKKNAVPTLFLNCNLGQNPNDIDSGNGIIERH